MPTIYGNASYYDLCNGSNGACAPSNPCDNTKNHAAWSYLFSNTGCSGGPQVQTGCNTGITAGDACQATAKAGLIRDACACTQANCNSGTYCNGVYSYNSTYRYPIIDLTRAYMLSLHGNLSDGRIKISVGF